MSIFMKYEGVEGESEVRGRRGFLELLSVAWGATRSTSAVKGGARGDADVQVHEVTVSRLSDSVSALLFLESVGGKFDRKVEIEFVRTGPNDRPVTDLSFVLENCGISSIQFSGAGDQKPVETLTLNFTKVTMKSFQIGDALSAVPFTGAFDLLTGKPS